MDDSYLTPYHDAAKQHGHGFETTLWASRRTQELRFEVFTQMCFFMGKRVLDAGCSAGDFAAYLLKKDQTYDHFVGLDGVPQTIARATQRGLPASTFLCGDFVADPRLLSQGEPQIITLSGTLNTMDDATALQLLNHAWNACSESLVFNFLSDRVSPEAPPQAYPARRLPTLPLLDWALTQASDVQFRQDYFPNGHDATLVMRK